MECSDEADWQLEGAVPCSDPRCDSDKLGSRAAGLHVGCGRKWLSWRPGGDDMSGWRIHVTTRPAQHKSAGGANSEKKWVCRALHSAVWNVGDAATPQASRRAEKFPTGGHRSLRGGEAPQATAGPSAYWFVWRQEVVERTACAWEIGTARKHQQQQQQQQRRETPRAAAGGRAAGIRAAGCSRQMGRLHVPMTVSTADAMCCVVMRCWRCGWTGGEAKRRSTKPAPLRYAANHQQGAPGPLMPGTPPHWQRTKDPR